MRFKVVIYVDGLAFWCSRVLLSSFRMPQPPHPFLSFYLLGRHAQARHLSDSYRGTLDLCEVCVPKGGNQCSHTDRTILDNLPDLTLREK